MIWIGIALLAAIALAPLAFSLRRATVARSASEDAPQPSSSSPILFALVLIPLGAFALYVVGGYPSLPAAPLADRIAAAQQREAQEAALIAQLRAKLASLDPHSEQARQGYVLLGNAEVSRGRLNEAAAAWRTALATR